MDDDLQVADTATVVLSGEPTAAQYVPPPQAYIVLSALYGAFVAVAFGLFVWRRNLEPIRVPSRAFFLTRDRDRDVGGWDHDDPSL